MTAWLRAQVEADKAAASALIGDGCTGIWEIDHYRAVRDSGSPARPFDGVVHDRATWRTVDAARARHADAQARHVAVHDPRDVIADCEAKLAALDLCERVIREDAGKHDDCGAADSWTGFAVARLTVQLLASGYRHRDGWQESWAT
jgi:hypothetical protein